MSTDSPSTPGLTLETAINEVSELVSDAVDFIGSELEPNWAVAERYYNGEVDLIEVENRSNVVKTEVRDAIRNTMPSIMRVLTHCRKPVEYIPSSVKHAPWVEQQAEYVTQLFYSSGGYMCLYSAVLDALKLKYGIIKVFWEPDPLPQYEHYTKVPFSFVEELIADPQFEIENFEAASLPDNVTQLGPQMFDVTGHRIYENGKVCIEVVPPYEFFISRHVNSIDMAIERGVHGQRGLVTVAEAMDMGLEYDDWITLDTDDPETSNHTTSSAERRGYNKDDVNSPTSVDILRHQFLLTEAYVRYDLEEKGRPQLYKFFLGGSSYEYIHHEKVEDSPFSIALPIPIPHTVAGHSMADLTINEQDTSTSVLRALVDNAHAANDAKIAADPSKTNFDDIMNPAINSPIRKRSGDTLQVIQVPFTGQGNLATLSYLDQDVQNKVGITKAAQGLDPDAMQSTDKQAVLNTIMTSQGQTELMVRNIIESCLIRVFKLMLKLSVRHMAPIQMLRTKGVSIPINILMFDPDAVAVPNVGLGTANPLQKQAALNYIYNEQKQVMEKYGPNNPFTSFSQMYNTLEDLMESNGIYNVGRYFNVVTPEVEQQWARAQEEQRKLAMEQAQQNQPMDPSKAYLEVEAGRAKLKQAEILTQHQQKAEELRLRAIDTSEKHDIDRDSLILDRILGFAKIEAQEKNAKAQLKNAQVNKKDAQARKEQESNERLPTRTGNGGEKSA